MIDWLIVQLTIVIITIVPTSILARPLTYLAELHRYDIWRLIIKLPYQELAASIFTCHC